MHTLARKKRNFIVVSLLVPTLLLIGFVVFPALDLIRMSFTNWDGYSPSSDFIALENYRSMFHNADLWQSLKNVSALNCPRSASIPRMARFIVAIFHVVGLLSWP